MFSSLYESGFDFQDRKTNKWKIGKVVASRNSGCLQGVTVMATAVQNGPSAVLVYVTGASGSLGQSSGAATAVWGVIPGP